MGYRAPSCTKANCIGQQSSANDPRTIHCASATQFTVRINVQARIVEDEVANERRDCEGYGKKAAVEGLHDLHLRAEQAGKIKIQ